MHRKKVDEGINFTKHNQSVRFRRLIIVSKYFTNITCGYKKGKKEKIKANIATWIFSCFVSLLTIITSQK